MPDRRLEGRVAIVTGAGAVGPNCGAGTVRGLAKTAEGGMDAVPTFAAAGLDGVDVASVWGLHMPPARHWRSAAGCATPSPR